MYYIPMDFEKLTPDGLIDTGALTSAISEQDLNKIIVACKRIDQRNWSSIKRPNNGGQWTIRGPNRHSITRIEVVDFMLNKNFIIIKKLLYPLVGYVLRKNK